MKLRMETVCDRVRKNELLRRAGTICEKEGNIPRALKLYQDGQCEKEIHALLIDNARRYPGGGYYYELTPAYLALPEEEVRSSPDLIAARSMLYSLALNATESERWYAVLQEYAADHPDPEEHRLAESWLVYLDISLPHRGSTNLIEVLDEAARKIQTERLVMPEFSVTGGQPSLINGSKDFCGTVQRGYRAVSGETGTRGTGYTIKRGAARMESEPAAYGSAGGGNASWAEDRKSEPTNKAVRARGCVAAAARRITGEKAEIGSCACQIGKIYGNDPK